MKRTGAWVSAAVGVVLVTSGCGGGGSASASGDSAPSTPLEQMVLADSEFPAGAKRLDLPPEKLKSTLSDLGGAMASSTVTPAECQVPQQDLSNASRDILGKSALVAATTDDMTVYVDFVASGVMDLTRITDTYTRCGTVQVSATTEGAKVDTEVVMDKLPAPGELSGSNAIAYRSTSTSNVDDKQLLSRTSYQGWVTLRDTTVGVRVSALSGVPDEAKFDKFFADAARKVRDAK
ncbi:hypothetical protein [Nocardia jejuensis]|uniref:hypothetical protein n=1 Tax=Nocardia jejuensis TaxID=328049 RepID=UPI0012FCA551|nr:hypothetical protein [Nocardia jejuensis]